MAKQQMIAQNRQTLKVKSLTASLAAEHRRRSKAIYTALKNGKQAAAKSN